MFGAPLPSRVWPYVIASALAEAAYYIALTRAYSIGDFSLVYPLARGAAPAFLALWAVLFLGERPGTGGLAGLALLVCGLVVVGSGAWWARRHGAPVSLAAVGTALTVACLISIYSAIDGAAVRIASPTPYIVLTIGLSAVLIAPVVLLRYGSRAVIVEWGAHWRPIVLVGVLTLITYLLVLQAYTLAPVAYAGAIRELSVVFAAIIGWRWLGERFGGTRTIGASLIFVGILVIAVAG